MPPDKNVNVSDIYALTSAYTKCKLGEVEG